MEINQHRLYVKITAKHDTKGRIKPVYLHWEDGRKFEVDKVVDVRKAVSLTGEGMLYACRIAGKQVNLFCDAGRWFIEK